MKSRFLHIFIFLLPFTLYGQGKVYYACFNAAQARGCAPFTVQMHDCSGSKTKFYDFGDGSPIGTDSNHTYAKPGKYTVTQIVDNGVSATDDTIRVDYIEVLSPSISATYNVKVCTGNLIILTVTDNIDNFYAVNFGDGGPNGLAQAYTPLNHTYPDNTPKTIQVVPLVCGTARDTTIVPLAAIIKPDITKLEVLSQGTPGKIALTFNAIASQRYYVQMSENNAVNYTNVDTLQGLSGTQTLIYNNLDNTGINQYCFRILAYDDCNPPLASEQVCSIINISSAVPNLNNVSWNSSDAGNVTSYTVTRNNTVLTTTTSTNTTDSPVNCGMKYCYQVTGQIAGSIQSISASQCVTAFSNNIPPAVQNLNSTISGNNVQLTWDKPSAGVLAYQVSRSVNGGSYSNAGSAQTNNYTDPNIDLSNSYCYEVDYKDTCKNKAPASAATCPVILAVQVDPANNNQNFLSWTSYQGSWPVSSYIIEKLDANNNVVGILNPGTAFNYTDVVALNTTQVLRYRIKADDGGSQFSYSNIVEIRYEGQVFLPNAFTPNGDGHNDAFTGKGKFIKEYLLTVYDRWGEVVFSTKELDTGWDGTYNGGDALNDAYAYLMEATDLWGKKITKRGTVTLLR